MTDRIRREWRLNGTVARARRVVGGSVARRSWEHVVRSAGHGQACGDRGSASLLVVAIGTLIAALALAAIGAIGILAGQARAAQAADLAALAAAEQVWFGETVACAEAGRIAEANGARLRECAADGLDAQVRVELPAPLPLVGAFAQARGLTVGATARAGPPDEL